MDQTTSVHIAGWLACAAFVMMMINGGFKLAHNFKGEPPTPANSNLGQSVAELNRRVTVLESRHEELLEKMDEDKSEILKAGEDRARRLHDRIDDMPSQIITTLKNTGAI